MFVVGRAGMLFRESIREYERRASRYWKLQVVEIPSGTGAKGQSRPDRVIQVEEAKLLKKIPDGTEVVALTRLGKAMGSVEFARYLERKALNSTSEIAFLIGGAFGLGPGVMERADQTFSLSSVTFHHQLARLLLTEQLYRAGTILRNEPYHKGGS